MPAHDGGRISGTQPQLHARTRVRLRTSGSRPVSAGPDLHSDWSGAESSPRIIRPSAIARLIQGMRQQPASLPSASMLAALRREESERLAGREEVAVVADPVFSGDDPRVGRRGKWRRTPSHSVPGRLLLATWSHAHAEMGLEGYGGSSDLVWSKCRRGGDIRWTCPASL